MKVVTTCHVTFCESEKNYAYIEVQILVFDFCVRV